MKFKSITERGRTLPERIDRHKDMTDVGLQRRFSKLSEFRRLSSKTHIDLRSFKAYLEIVVDGFVGDL